MEARYFSEFKRGPYKQLISLLRNATRNRAVIAISIIGKSILEIVTPKNEADRLVIGLDAIGYGHLSKFEPTKNAISTLKVMSAEERKRENLELSLSRYERSAHNCHSHRAAKWYKQQEKRIRHLILCESFESAMVINSNAEEESSAPTPNATRSQLVGQKTELINLLLAKRIQSIKMPPLWTPRIPLQYSYRQKTMQRQWMQSQWIQLPGITTWRLKKRCPSPIAPLIKITWMSRFFNIHLDKSLTMSLLRQATTRATRPLLLARKQKKGTKIHSGLIGIMMAHRHTTMSFATLNEARRKNPKTLLHRRSYQQEPKREAKFPFPFGARNPAAISFIRR